MDQLPKVSILIPTYNQQDFIEKAIKSALQQDYKNLEIIIANDNSTDNTEARVQPYLENKNIRYFKNDINIGRVANYRKSLYEYASGDWALLLDGDDYLTDDTYITTCINMVTGYPEKSTIAFIQAGDQLINTLTGFQKIRVPTINNDIQYIKGIQYFLGFLKYRHFSHMATFFNRKLAIKAGFYLHDILSADIESFLRLSLLGDVVLLKKVVGVWLHHGTNASQQNNIRLQLDNLQWIENCKEYAARQQPQIQKRLPAWSKHILHDNLVSIVNSITRSPDTGKISLQKDKLLLHYIRKKSPSLFISPKFLLMFMVNTAVLVKKYLFARG